MPSGRPIFFFTIQNTHVIKLNTRSTHISIILSVINEIGLIAAATPKIKRMLNTLDPTTFPTAISSSFFLAAASDVASSGSEVPHATMVSPIRVSDTPKNPAKSTAPSTTQSPPNCTATAPPTI